MVDCKEPGPDELMHFDDNDLANAMSRDSYENLREHAQSHSTVQLYVAAKPALLERRQLAWSISIDGRMHARLVICQSLCT